MHPRFYTELHCILEKHGVVYTREREKENQQICSAIVTHNVESNADCTHHQIISAN